MNTTQNRPLALVTGPTSGIGLEFARQLAARGHDLALVSRDEARLHETAERLLREHGAQSHVIPADLGRTEDVRRVEDWIRAHPELSMLVNNAGFATKGAFHEANPDDIQSMVDVMVTALLRLTNAALPAMLQAKRGTILNVSSISGFTDGAQVYGASKTLVNQVTVALARQYGPQGVRFQALCPGFTRTEFHQRMGVNPAAEWGVPDEIWMTPDQIVTASLKGLELGEVLCVPGLTDPALLRALGDAGTRLVDDAKNASEPAARYRE